MPGLIIMKRLKILDSFWLHIIAMSIMLMDHLWGTIIKGNGWMTNVGRLAFPIFAFMVVEGFFYTKNVKKYILRLLAGALISEIPFNIMMSGEIIDPFEQNVLWTFLIGLLCMETTSSIKKKNLYLGIFLGCLIFALGILIGFLLMVDYSGYGVATIGLFYWFRGDEWWKKIIQFMGLVFINAYWFKGLVIDVTLFGRSFEMVQQGFACLAILIIWLYNGKKGLGGKGFQIFCYLFYPVHILILSLLAIYVF